MAPRQQRKTGKSKASPGERRRARIMVALHDCVVSQGYSKTTLNDIAKAADMSASHLLYYFQGKDAILAYYFKSVADLLLERLDSFAAEPAEDQIDLLTGLFFDGKGMTRSEIGFMLECFGAAVHDSKLRRMKTRLDRKSKAYLADLFETLSGSNGRKAQDAAELAYAILIGLRTASYFDKNLKLSEARRLFHDTIVRLAEAS